MADTGAAAGAEEEDETSIKLGILVGLIALNAAFIIGFFLEKHHIHWLPESAAAVLVGLAACTIVSAAENKDLMSKMRFDMEFFMNWLIPPIIFEAAFNMNVSAFFKNMRPTLFFAFVGTLVSTFVVAGVVFGAGQLGLCYPLSPLAALSFGSLISATGMLHALRTRSASWRHLRTHSSSFDDYQHLHLHTILEPLSPPSLRDSVNRDSES